MKKIIHLTFILLFPCYVFAQTINNPNLNTKKLQEFSKILTTESENQKSKAIKMAKSKNWYLESTDNQGNVSKLIGVTPDNKPIYYKTFSNVDAAKTVGTYNLWPGGSTGLNLSASTPALKFKLAIWDGGAVRRTHQEFYNRIIQFDNATSLSTHATHVMGTMMAKGIREDAKGMSFNLDSAYAYDWNDDEGEMALAAFRNGGILLSNHSYGFITGWSYNSNGFWYFYGPNGYDVDPGFGYYGTDAKDVDEIMYNAKNYLVVRAAGNNRTENGPAVGESYYGLNENNNFVLKIRPLGISNNDNYQSIGHTSNAKNILSVGAVLDIPNGYRTPNDVQVTDFSSWGPTNDGRIKPDIVGNGFQVLSTSSTTDQSYTVLSGTSMASPNVTGSLLLLQELYYKYYNKFMWSSSLKAIALHTASESGAAIGPDFIYGWGLLNAKDAGILINEFASKNNSNTSNSILIENTLNNFDTIRGNFISSGKEPVKLTLVWTDYPGVVGTYLNLNDTINRLVNNLDMYLIDEQGNKFYPWKLDGRNPANPATTGINNKDNVEKIETFNAKPGITYQYVITNKDTLKTLKQDFSLVISGVGGNKFCQSQSRIDTNLQIDSISINNIQQNFKSNNNYLNLTDSIILLKSFNNDNKIFVKIKKNNSIFNPLLTVFLDYNNSGTFEPAEIVFQTNQFDNNTAQGTLNFNILNPNMLANQFFRIILQDTNTTNVSPCLNYTNGETIDYSSIFIEPTHDLILNSIVAPDTNFNPCSGAQIIQAKLHNYGSQPTSTFKIKYIVYSNSTFVDSSSETITNPILPYSNLDVHFQKKINFLNSTNYTIKIFIEYSKDENAINDTITKLFYIPNVTTPNVNTEGITSLGCGMNYNLNVANPKLNQTYIWSTGNQLSNIISAKSTDVFYATNNNPVNFYINYGFTGNFGALNNNISATGNYHNADTGGGGNWIKFYTAAPMKILSAKMYTGNAGTIRIIVANSLTSSGSSYTYSPIAEKLIDVQASSPTPSPFSIPKVNGDSGRYYNLDIDLPYAGNYWLIVVTENNATIFRNNNVTGFTIPNGNPKIFTYDNNSANSASFYYYLYDLKVQTINNCQSVPVNVTATKNPTPVLTFSDDTLYSSITGNLIWYLDDIQISTNNNYIIPLKSGTYKVVKSYSNGCPETSADFPFQFVAKPYNTKAEIGFKLYPTITAGSLNLEFKIITAPDFAFELYDFYGQKVYEQPIPNARKQTLNLPYLNSGIYFFRFRANGKYFMEKIFVSSNVTN